VEGMVLAIGTRTSSSGFMLYASVAQGQTSGTYTIHCTGGG
jgi:hypothetical protein